MPGSQRAGMEQAEMTDTGYLIIICLPVIFVLSALIFGAFCGCILSSRISRKEERDENKN